MASIITEVVCELLQALGNRIPSLDAGDTWSTGVSLPNTHAQNTTRMHTHKCMCTNRHKHTQYSSTCACVHINVHRSTCSHTPKTHIYTNPHMHSYRYIHKPLCTYTCTQISRYMKL